MRGSPRERSPREQAWIADPIRQLAGAGGGGREAKRSGLAAASILTARLLVVENFSGQDEIQFCSPVRRRPGRHGAIATDSHRPCGTRPFLF